MEEIRFVVYNEQEPDPELEIGIEFVKSRAPTWMRELIGDHINDTDNRVIYSLDEFRPYRTSPGLIKPGLAESDNDDVIVCIEPTKVTLWLSYYENQGST
jgi:hypothetical protein